VQSSRRVFLKSGLAGVGASAIGAGGLLAESGGVAAAAPETGSAGVVPFYGTHQAGIATPAQNYLQFGSFDMAGDSIGDLKRLLLIWTDAAARMSVGKQIGPIRTGDKPPDDTGEAIGLGPSSLTVTFGFGASLFSSDGVDRFGLAKHQPAPLVDLPAFHGDALQADICGGDIGVQVCANDPQVAFHAMHDLIKQAASLATPKWLLAGAGRTGNSNRQALPRNLMGFQDGTANIVVEDTEALDKFVWASEPTSPGWMRGGSYLVARRIQIALELWDTTSLNGQQQTIGREKLSGALLPVVPPTSHLLLASPAHNGGQRILRRGYSFVDGIDPTTGFPAVGLMFLCYQKDPRRQFIPIQTRLAGADALSLYLTHIGSAVFAFPPGAKPGEFVGQGLIG
jgi:deferrochelatase/peroxidase EfeB